MRDLASLRAHLEAVGWHPQPVEENPIALWARHDLGAAGIVRCFFQLIPAPFNQFLFFIVPELTIPPAHRPLIADYITRVNYDMRIGNFEMDFADGEIRFKSSLHYAEERLTPGWLDAAIFPALEAVKLYLPGFPLVLAGRLPTEVIATLEAPPPTSPT